MKTQEPHAQPKPTTMQRTARHMFTTIRPQPRKTRPADEILRNMGTSVLTVGQIHPLVLQIDDGEEILLDGECRVRGVMLLDRPDFMFDVTVLNRKLEEGEAAILQLSSDIHRNSIPAIDQAVALKKWLDEHPGATATELAKKLCISKAYVSKLLSLFKTGPAVQKAATEGKLPSAAWQQISQVADDAQEGVLAMYLASLPSEQIADHCRRLRKPATQGDAAKQQSRVTCVLPSGVRIVMTSAAGLDIPLFIENMQTGIDLGRKASRENLDVRTAEKVWKDRARKTA